MDPDRGNVGPTWIASGVALLCAIITLVFVHPLTHDGLEREEIEFREYLEANGWDTNQMGLTTIGGIQEIEQKGVGADNVKDIA